MSKFKCSMCGDCCRRLLSQIPPPQTVSKEDILRWKKEKRDDILRYVLVFVIREKESGFIRGDKRINKGLLLGGDIWFNPNTGEELDRCPFLRKIRGEKKYRCLIHETKPLVCKDFTCEGIKHQRSSSLGR